MNTLLKILLSMSFSGGLLIFVLLLGKQFLKNKISRQWQYYIWIAVILRLLLSFGPEVNLLGNTYQTLGQSITRAGTFLQQQSSLSVQKDLTAPAAEMNISNENVETMPENRAADLPTARPFRDITVLLANHAWLVWLMAALGLLIRKLTIYQSFMRYIRAGSTPVSDLGMLNQLSITADQAGIKTPVELCTNPLVSSPQLIGFFHPCIVLPGTDISEKDFRYILLHELIHYKRLDLFYKWLVQITVCLHWFNPLVHLMGREITRACEFSCDEAVLSKMGYDNAQDYGKTLLTAMATVGRYKENPGAVTLSENKQLLKERLGAIMNFRKKSITTRLLTGVLTLCIIFGAACIGVYPAAASNQTLSPTDRPAVPESQNSPRKEAAAHGEDYAAQAKEYYEAGSLPLFGIAFARLDENAQKAWLEKIYADGEVSFFSVAVHRLDASSPLLADFAKKAYEDEETALFSILTDCMGKAELESWLDRALEDEKWNFQSILFDKLDRSDEFDELEEKADAAQKAEYLAAGVIVDGKNYYYQEQLVNVFLDVRANKSFYTLNMNPAGTVNIKIIRDADNKITGVSYMTEAEVIELFSDMDDPDD